jgi:hypothetical protein
MFGMLWVDVFDVIQFTPISNNFVQPLKEWDNIPQATINSLINPMRRGCVELHEANGGHTRY